MAVAGEDYTSTNMVLLQEPDNAGLYFLLKKNDVKSSYIKKIRHHRNNLAGNNV
jgi:hypothetical protein